MKLALCLIVKGSDTEADALAQALKYTADHVDGIFITITQPNERVEEVCKIYNTTVSHFEWCNDFSKARNFNFSQVPEDFDYILWMDADDAYRGLENLKSAIEKNPADVYSVNYLYAFDEWKNPIVVHPKAMVIKNDGCVEWAGALHEDFKENRELTRYFIKDIERLHLSNDERFGEAKERNLEVAKHQVETEPNDPRSYWNLGNSYKALGKDSEALEAFEKFLETSQSDDEKYIVRLRRAESLWSLGNKPKAIEEAQFAIGLKPHYPDAYHLLGSLYLESNRNEEAAAMFKSGLLKKPPYYKIIVYNPRDYDYVPLMNLAKAYFNLSLPTLAMVCLQQCVKIYPKDKSLKHTIKLMETEVDRYEKAMKEVKKLLKLKGEDLKKALDKVPTEFQSHPAICNIRNTNFIKEESNGKDLVIFCGFTEEEWSPKTAIEKGIGGSEEAVIHLSKRFAKAGYNVTVYNNIGHEAQEFDGVTYKPFWSWNYRDKQDITILWRTPRYADYDINSRVFVDMHDVYPEGEFTPKRMEKIEKVFVKSNFHRSLFPNISDDKIAVIPNGIEYEKFIGENKDDLLVINTSSPDRSISAYINIAKRVKKEIPEARFVWAYGWTVFDHAHGSNSEIMTWKEKQLKDMEGVVENLGRLGHEEIKELYEKANIFLYPTEFAEIDCISYTKAVASGCYPITTDFAALGDKAGVGFQVHSGKTKDDWAGPYQFDFALKDEAKLEELSQEVIKALKEKKQVNKEWAKAYDWSNVCENWLKILENH